MMYQIFGSAPTIRILDWMIENQQYDHSLKEIANGAGIGIVVAKRNFVPLLDHNVVKINRTVGRDELYVLDLQNRCTKAIIEFDGKIAKCCELQEHPDGMDNLLPSEMPKELDELVEDEQEQSPMLILPPEM